MHAFAGNFCKHFVNAQKVKENWHPYSSSRANATSSRTAHVANNALSAWTTSTQSAAPASTCAPSPMSPSMSSPGCRTGNPWRAAYLPSSRFPKQILFLSSLQIQPNNQQNEKRLKPFQALTAQSDAQARWSIVTFPIDIDTSSYQPSGTRKPTAGLVVDSSSTTAMPVVAEEEGLVTVNCTVAYMGQCMSWNKCKASCTSMGSSSYR